MKQVKLLTAVVAVALSFGMGCKKTAPAVPAGYSPNSTQAALDAGGKLNSDGSVTNKDGSITQPNGTTIPAAAVGGSMTAAPTPTPAPAPAETTAPAATAMTGPAMTGPPATPVEEPLTVPSGTAVVIRTTEQLSASHNEVGDRFTGVLENPILVHGRTAFASGTPVAGEVSASKGKGRFKGAGDLGITLTTIGKKTVHTSDYTLTNKGRGKRTAAFAGGGGGAGALIGGLAGGGKGALIGGLLGAGGGTAASAYTGSRDVIIRAESVITFRLTESVTR